MHESGQGDGQQRAVVTILLGAFNGARYLPEQLQSIAIQSWPNWQILASDDGSSDETPKILQDFARTHPLSIMAGPGQGLVRNFMHLLQALPDAPPHVAFCDQDDVWLPEKLETALEHLRRVPEGCPALYCSRRLIWDPERGSRTASRAYPHPPSFANALIENIAPGNTIVLNPAAAALARDLAGTGGDVFAHDWWLYLLIAGVGGQVIYDPEPRLLYRQHAGNVIGAGEQLSRQIGNKRAVWRGAFADRVGGNIAAMQAVVRHLTPENARRLELLAQARAARLPRRLALLRRAGVWRQGRLSGATFWGAACLGKV